MPRRSTLFQQEYLVQSDTTKLETVEKQSDQGSKRENPKTTKTNNGLILVGRDIASRLKKEFMEHRVDEESRKERLDEIKNKSKKRLGDEM